MIDPTRRVDCASRRKVKLSTHTDRTERVEEVEYLHMYSALYLFYCTGWTVVSCAVVLGGVGWESKSAGVLVYCCM